MLGQKRKYDDEDKMKDKIYYQKHKEEIKARNKKHREELKKGKIAFTYARNPNTKKCKELKRKIEKADKQIIEAKLLCIEERKKLRNKQLNDKVKKIAKIKKQMKIKGVQNE